MENPKLGQVFNSNGDLPDRDAIHVAIIPLVLGEDFLRPGDRVKLAFGTKNIVIGAEYNHGDEWIGVIDPFIEDFSMKKGNVVYVLLKPGTITGLRHHWFHPVFDVESKPIGEAEAWLRKFAEEWNFDYNEMIAVATNPTDWQDWITAWGRELHSVEELGEDYNTFWEKIEELTNRKFDEEHRKKVSWFCSC